MLRGNWAVLISQRGAVRGGWVIGIFSQRLKGSYVGPRLNGLVSGGDNDLSMMLCNRRFHLFTHNYVLLLVWFIHNLQCLLVNVWS